MTKHIRKNLCLLLICGSVLCACSRFSPEMPTAVIVTPPETEAPGSTEMPESSSSAPQETLPAEESTEAFIIDPLPTEPETEPEVPLPSGTVLFDMSSGLYRESITVSLSLADASLYPEAEIRYTLNGNEPRESDSLYTGPLTLEIGEDVSVFALRAAAFGCGEGKVFSQNYVLMPEDSPLNGMAVVCIDTDSDNLYHSKTGIFKHYNARGDNWIRPAFVTIIGADGTVETDDGLGIGVSGNTTSHLAVKALKLVAEEEYGTEKGLFYTYRSDTEVSVRSHVTEHSTLLLRQGGQDIRQSNLRTAVSCRLGREAGFTGISRSDRAVLFLNGEVYGLFDILERPTPGTFRDIYGLPDNQVTCYKGSEIDGLDRMHEGCRALFLADLNDPENRAALEKVVDIDNYIQFYTVNMLLNNTDWPQNNYCIWRYDGEPDPDNPYSDGRLRFWSYDADLCFASSSMPTFFNHSRTNAFRSMTEGLGRYAENCFVHLISCPYYREKFVNYLSELLEGPFSYENMDLVWNEAWDEIRDVQEYLAPRIGFYRALGLDFGLMTQKAEELHKKMLSYASGYRDNLRQYLGLSELTEVTVRTSAGAMAVWSSQELYQSSAYTCRYYGGTDITFRAEPYPGFRFVFWTVNDQAYTDPELTLSPAEAAADGKLDIRLYCIPEDGPRLILTAVRSSGGNDFVTLTNVGSAPMDTAGYSLSDRPEKPFRLWLPYTELAPGESLTLRADAEDDFLLDFGLARGETLVLYHNGEAADCVQLPRQDAAEMYCRPDNGPVWRYQPLQQHCRRELPAGPASK